MNIFATQTPEYCPEYKPYSTKKSKLDPDAVSMPSLFGMDFLDMPSFPSYEGGFFMDSFCEERVFDDTGKGVYDSVLDFYIDEKSPSQVYATETYLSDPPAAALHVPPIPALTQPISFRETLPEKRMPSPVLTSKKRTLMTKKAIVPKTDAEIEDEKLLEKREKNRLAAEKCRNKKFELISSLQQECDELRARQERILSENKILIDALTAAGIPVPTSMRESYSLISQ